MDHPPPDSRGPAEGRPRQQPAAELHRFLRYSHIFSAAIREILGTRYLGEVCQDRLTLPQFHLLKLIALNGQHQIGEVAHFLGVSSPAATKSIDKLERLGLVTRSPSQGDRRATLLAASPKGYALVQRYEERKARRLAPVIEGFTSEEIEQLSTLLERFAVSLLQHERPGRGYCLRCAVYIDEGCPVGRTRGGCSYQHLRDARGSTAEA
jgi:DNA-binding MarR family transcriptional regulator